MTDHMMIENKKSNIYTCSEYREEMILAGLKKRIDQTGLSEQERSEIEKEILRLEKVMDF
jgi:hypothetical protein